MMNWDNLLERSIRTEASDIHLSVGYPPFFRIHGRLLASDLPAVDEELLQTLIDAVVSEDHRQKLNQERSLDCSFVWRKGRQFRVNVYFEKGKPALTVRAVPPSIPAREELGLPEAVDVFAMKRKGLIIVAGPAGSGKSTTLNYMIDQINRKREGKIITIEDPIEYIHPSKNCLIVQREVGIDTPSFASALKYALRQDPDVVMIGEIRDLESIAMALTTAETGHLVITTLHAPDAVETINRIIDVFPAEKRDQICVQLAENLIGVIAQMLLPRQDREGRVLATEVLAITLPVRNLIRRGALTEIRGALESEEQVLMHSFEQRLSELVHGGVISAQTAREFSKNPHHLKLPSSGDAPVQKQHRAARILLCEPQDKDARSMAKALVEQGFEDVVLARTPEAAWRALQEQRFDAVVLTLPQETVDAFEFCRRLKSVNPSIKIVMITGALKTGDPEEATKAGADEFAVKTAQWDLLIKALHKAGL